MRPIVALLTDFGQRDHYVATMKAVMLGICRELSFVDITHDIAPQDIAGAAHQLAASYAYFPAGTIFLVVVDPGVGSARRAIAAEAGGYRFVAPDNGVLSVVLQQAPPLRLVELTEPRYARATMSRTFEGRDRFAPAAAWLASGVDLASLGGAVADYQRADLPELRRTADELQGTVVLVDRFGNLLTDIDRVSVARFAAEHPAAAEHLAISVSIEGIAVPRIVATYDEIAAGEICALYSSTDHLEIAVRAGSAADRLGLGRGARVRLGRR